jgi:hypothetical protein
MNVGAPFVAHAQSPELMQPAAGAFDNPTVDAQSASMLGVALGQEWLDSRLPQSLAVRLRVVGAIGVRAFGASLGGTGLSANRWNGINQHQQLRHVVGISGCDSRDQWNPVAVGDDMVFGAGFAAIRRIWTGLVPPKTARTDVESTAARDQLIWSASRSRSKSTPWILFQTPFLCHSASRRQQVIPLPQPISCGRSSQAIPVLSTNKMPVSTARFSSGFRPGYRLRRRLAGGGTGSMICHKRSSKIGFATSVPPCTSEESNL